MCSTIIYQYKCGCTERVVFECPFSSTTTSNKSLHAHAHQNCSRRYRLHQQKLFPPQKPTVTTTTLSSHEAPSFSMLMKLPILPPPNSYYANPDKTKEQKTNASRITEIDEICHDCWQRSRRLTKQRDGDDGASSVTTTTTTRDGQEDKENMVNARVLRERPVNELFPPPSSTSLGAVSSTESFSEG